ncbi:MAG: superoxide dismutase family protein [Limisphaerales bacterium]
MKTVCAVGAFAAASIFCFHSISPVLAAEQQHGDAAHAQAWASVKQAVAVLHPTANHRCRGVVRFTQDGDNVKVVADIEGLDPGQKHAFHIHQFGDVSSPDGMSAGGHYNPEAHPHGLPAAEMRHAGDLGNLEANSEGKVHYEITVSNISIAGTKNPIIGRGVIVHAKVDDGSQPVGNAGARIASGVIGVANPGK